LYKSFGPATTLARFYLATLRTCSSPSDSFCLLPHAAFFLHLKRDLTPASLSDQEISSLVVVEINRAEQQSDLSLPWRNSTTARETIYKHFVLFGLEKTKVPSFRAGGTLYNLARNSRRIKIVSRKVTFLTYSRGFKS